MMLISDLIRAPRMGALLFVVLGCVLLASCKDATKPPVPTVLEMVAGDGQSATVNTAVTTPPAVRVLDELGNPMVGETVTFTVVAGGGSVPGASASTDATGLATAGAWTLGTTTGANRLRASSGALNAEFEAMGTTAGPASINMVIGDGQSAPVVSPVSISPSVRLEDEFGNPVEGRRVTFSPAQASGTVTGAAPNTDATGTAAVGSWRLGPQAGPQTLRATVTGLPTVEFIATAEPGSATQVIVVSGDGQTGAVGSSVAAPTARVADQYGNGRPGHTVTFAVTGGGGSVTGTTSTSGTNGTVTVGSWTLGTLPGENTLSASAPGLTPVTFTATAEPGPPASLVVAAGDAQTADPGAEVPVRPAVRVSDAFGNVVPQAAVTFAVASGGGSVSGAMQVTDFTGEATVGGWTLGAAAGQNTLTATVAGVAPLTFTATGTPGGGGGSGSYSITIRYINAGTPAQQAAVAAAVARWEEVIVGDQADAQVSDPAVCGISGLAVNELVDDVIIYVDFAEIDGVGMILGQAGPCRIRNTNALTTVGIVMLDGADLVGMEANGTLENVILHEIGHVLGIGTLWETLGLLAAKVTSAEPSNLPAFTGAAAIAAFDGSGGQTHTGAKVPVENTGGGGTANSHWRESVMTNELMTGFIAPGASPLSLITVMSLQDIGYVIDAAAADSYTVTNPVRAHGDVEHLLQLKELPLPFAPKVDYDGPVIRR